jgi:DNA-binding NtrC family response regulator
MDSRTARGRLAGGGDLSPSGRKGRILFLDDVDSVVESAVTVLERLGFRVMGLTDPWLARELIRLKPEAFDLVITDQTMPGLSGLELAEEVHRLKPGLPFILCTGGDPPGSMEHLGRVGVQGLLFKPFSIRDVLEKIRRVVVDAPDGDVEIPAETQPVESS